MFDPNGPTNLTSLSNSDVASNNLTGQFTILFGYTTGGASFITPEPDGNYNVFVSPQELFKHWRTSCAGSISSSIPN